MKRLASGAIPPVVVNTRGRMTLSPVVALGLYVGFSSYSHARCRAVTWSLTDEKAILG